MGVVFLWVWVCALEEEVMDDDVGDEIQGRRFTVSRDARTTEVPESSVVTLHSEWTSPNSLHCSLSSNGILKEHSRLRTAPSYRKEDIAVSTTPSHQPISANPSAQTHLCQLISSIHQIHHLHHHIHHHHHHHPPNNPVATTHSLNSIPAQSLCKQYSKNQFIPNTDGKPDQRTMMNDPR